MPRRVPALPLGLALGVAADSVLGDPGRGHPVAVLGAAAQRLERALWRPTRRAGVVHLLACLLPVGAAVRLLDARAAARPGRRVALVGLLTWVVLGARSLRAQALRVEAALRRGQLELARRRLPALCGRDAAALDAAGVRRAVIESVAENTSDAVVAPLLWGAVAGPAGLVGYRVVNTLDAMVGHRSEAYRRFGWAAARTDDAANLVPARVTALLTVLLAGLVRGDAAGALRAWRRDAAGHPSPNAGPCEAAFAGALGVRLGGPVRYSYGLSERPWLGEQGRVPTAGDVERAVAMSRAVTVAAAAAAVLLAAGLHR